MRVWVRSLARQPSFGRYHNAVVRSAVTRYYVGSNPTLPANSDRKCCASMRGLYPRGQGWTPWRSTIRASSKCAGLALDRRVILVQVQEHGPFFAGEVLLEAHAARNREAPVRLRAPAPYSKRSNAVWVYMIEDSAIVCRALQLPADNRNEVSSLVLREIRRSATGKTCPLPVWASWAVLTSKRSTIFAV